MRLLASVNVVDRGGVPVAAVSGEVDIMNATSIRNDLMSAAPNTAPGLVVDLSDATYLDSRGVQLLLELAERLRRRQQWLRISVPASSSIRRVLTLTHLDAIIPLHESVEAAVAAAEAPPG